MLTKQFLLARANLIYEEYLRKSKEEIWKEREFANKYLGEVLAGRITKSKLSKEQIINNIYQDLIGFNDVSFLSTPWKLEPKDEVMYGFDENDNLPVIFGDEEGDIYTHYVSEEFVLGVLLIPEIADRFIITLNDSHWYFGEHNINITIDMIIDKYLLTENTPNKRFVAITKYGPITFDSSDVIRGLVTAASWLNISSHEYIFDIREDGVSITF